MHEIIVSFRLPLISSLWLISSSPLSTALLPGWARLWSYSGICKVINYSLYILCVCVCLSPNSIRITYKNKLWCKQNICNVYINKWEERKKKRRKNEWKGVVYIYILSKEAYRDTISYEHLTSGNCISERKALAVKNEKYLLTPSDINLLLLSLLELFESVTILQIIIIIISIIVFTIITNINIFIRNINDNTIFFLLFFYIHKHECTYLYLF